MLGFRDENKSEFARSLQKNLRNIKIRMCNQKTLISRVAVIFNGILLGGCLFLLYPTSTQKSVLSGS